MKLLPHCSMQQATKKIILIALILTVFTQTVFAQNTVSDATTPIEKTFVVGPAKMETEIVPGNSKNLFLTIENRTGRTQMFGISFEDFVASESLDQAIDLLGENKSETSLKDWLYVPQRVVTLLHGDRMQIPVTVSVPVGTEAGGRFGAVVVSAIPESSSIGDESRAFTGAVVLGRVATLLFVTVAGDVEKAGELVLFETKAKKNFFSEDKIDLRVRFENSGTVSLNPYGVVVLKSVLGTKREIIVEPWYVLPGSVRSRDIALENLSSGFYTATLRLNRGYENQIDERAVSFVVLTPGAILSLVIIIGALAFGLRTIMRRRHD